MRLRIKGHTHFRRKLPSRIIKVLYTYCMMVKFHTKPLIDSVCTSEHNWYYKKLYLAMIIEHRSTKLKLIYTSMDHDHTVYTLPHLHGAFCFYICMGTVARVIIWHWASHVNGSALRSLDIDTACSSWGDEPQPLNTSILLWLNDAFMIAWMIKCYTFI